MSFFKYIFCCIFFIFSSYAAADVTVQRVGNVGIPVANLPDAQINAALIDMIAKDSMVASLNVGTSVYNGIVSLVGTVKFPEQAYAIIALASSAAGVRDVDTTQLTVVGGVRLNPDEILKAKIQGKLIQQQIFGNINVHQIPIGIRVLDGIVTFTGEPNSTAQMLNIIRMTQWMPGVRRVISEMTVKIVTNVPTS
jgi:osmotically-inducible protein OsmY